MQVAHSYHWFHGLIHTEFCTSCSTPFKCLRVNIHSFSSYVPVTWLAAIIFPCHPRTASFWVCCNVMHLLCLRQVTGPQVALSSKGTCQRIYTSRARKSDDLAHWGSCILVAVMSFLLEQEWETIWACYGHVRSFRLWLWLVEINFWILLIKIRRWGPKLCTTNGCNKWTVLYNVFVNISKIKWTVLCISRNLCVTSLLCVSQSSILTRVLSDEYWLMTPCYPEAPPSHDTHLCSS